MKDFSDPFGPYSVSRGLIYIKNDNNPYSITDPILEGKVSTRINELKINLAKWTRLQEGIYNA